MKRYIILLCIPLVCTAVAGINISSDSKDIECLAKNIYFEARNDNLAGQVAITDVVLNRVLNASYPNDICEVVYQGPQDSRGNMIRNKCQFSWYCDGKSDKIPYPSINDSWWRAMNLASDMYYNDAYRGITEGSTHYHASYVDPAWSKDLQLVGRIGAHIFYRKK